MNKIKKFIFILLSIILLSGCQSSPNSTEPQTFFDNSAQYTTENIGEDENRYLVQSPSELEKPTSESILTEPPILTISTLDGSVEANFTDSIYITFLKKNCRSCAAV